MTNGEKMFIAQQLKQGLGYSEIARKLNMSVNTVKSYCQRNGLKRTGESAPSTNDVCRRCGCALVHTPGRKRKQFCSDICRLCWWHEHRYMSKTAKGVKCVACGREFITDRGQKYCSHGCYIRMRFGGNHGNGTQQAQ